MYRLIFILFLSIINYTAQSQYINTVTTPDRTVSVIRDNNDAAYRNAQHIKADNLKKHLEYIASDELQGRETGQPGIELAAQYISAFLRKNEIFSLPGHRNYRQPIAFTYSKWSDTDIYVKGERFRHLWDYIAFPTKNNNVPLVMDNEVIFLGYGIDDPMYSDYKEYRNKKLKDKIILINKGEPLKKDSTSFITGTRSMSDWSDADMKKKLEAAARHGVKLVLVIENDIKKVLEENRRKLLGAALELGDFKNDSVPYPNHCFISSTIAKSIIGTMDKKVIDARKKLAKGKPAMVALPTDFIMNMSKDVTVLKGDNIFGIIEGRSKKDEFVIVSAHYDHLGMRGDDIYNGADDNGSGTVTLMELAAAFQKAVLDGFRPERSVLFLWVAGEEKGLLGSEYYTKNPLVPLENTIANVNVDMVGRMDDKYKNNTEYIYVIGSDRLSSDLHKINEDINQKYSHLTLDYTYNDANDPNQYYYRSDHYNFAKNGIPAIFFFSGTHADYHRPSDTVEKIDFGKMEKVGRHIFHLIWDLANRPNRIAVDGAVK